jgi:hypothetical protein
VVSSAQLAQFLSPPLLRGRRSNRRLVIFLRFSRSWGLRTIFVLPSRSFGFAPRPSTGAFTPRLESNGSILSPGTLVLDKQIALIVEMNFGERDSKPLLQVRT